MSNDNVKLIQEAYAAFGRRDMEALIGAMTPDVDWAMVGRASDFPTFGAWPGADKVREFFRSVGDTIDFHDFSPREFYPSGDKVFVLGRYEGTVKKTGRRLASDWVHVFTIRDGKVAQFREFADTAAIAEAGR
jgi:ketosteroid isomerase-like protein